MNDDSVKKISTAIRKERHWKLALVAALLVLAVGLTGLFVLRLADRSQAHNQQRTIDQVVAQLTSLCETGALDCQGQRGLPGFTGVPGTGIRSITCVSGRFRFALTNGLVTTIGDCIAEAGPRGKIGHRGPRGFRGPRGLTGPRGQRGRRGARGPIAICHGHCREGLGITITIPRVSGNRSTP